jgi:hypothetical protein
VLAVPLAHGFGAARTLHGFLIPRPICLLLGGVGMTRRQHISTAGRRPSPDREFKTTMFVAWMKTNNL